MRGVFLVSCHVGDPDHVERVHVRVRLRLEGSPGCRCSCGFAGKRARHAWVADRRGSVCSILCIHCDVKPILCIKGRGVWESNAAGHLRRLIMQHRMFCTNLIELFCMHQRMSENEHRQARRPRPLSVLMKHSFMAKRPHDHPETKVLPIAQYMAAFLVPVPIEIPAK